MKVSVTLTIDTGEDAVDTGGACAAYFIHQYGQQPDPRADDEVTDDWAAEQVESVLVDIVRAEIGDLPFPLDWVFSAYTRCVAGSAR